MKKLLLLAIPLLFLPYNSIISNYLNKKAGIVAILIGNGGGTGFHFKMPNNKWIILTNKHVCDDAKVVKVSDGDTIVERKVITTSPDYDLCAVEPTKEFGLDNTDEPSNLLPSITAGHGALSPITTNIGFHSGKVFMPICVEALFFSCSKSIIIELDAYDLKVIGGHSGSPIMDLRGNLVGVINAGNGLHSFAVPIKHVREFLSNLMFSEINRALCPQI